MRLDGRGLDPSPVWRNNVKGLTKSLRAKDYRNPPYSESYPALKEINPWLKIGEGVPGEGNLFVSGRWLRIFWLAQPEHIEVRDNWLVPEDGDPGWVDPEDPERDGWALREDAPILRVTGFHHLPLERIGLCRDDYRADRPKTSRKARRRRGALAPEVGG